MKRTHGFSLTELTAVLAIIVTFAGLATPAFVSITRGNGVSDGTFKVANALQMARAHAMANKTYVWVGFCEQAFSSPLPSTTPPPYAGKGRIALAIVASRDGTPIFEADSPAAPIPADRVFPLDKVEQVANVHLGDVGAPSGQGDLSRLSGRPAFPYEGPDDAQNRISSDTSEVTPYPFDLQGYTFYKTVRFSPRGEASINGGPLRNLGEIGIQPAPGGVVSAEPNVRAVQFAGITGTVVIYAP